MTRRQINLAALDGVEADFLGSDPLQPLVAEELRLVRLPPEQLRPDPRQPRRILPPDLHARFHREELSAVAALRLLIERVREVARTAGRPFKGPWELLPGSEAEADPQAQTPEEETLRELVQLAATLEADGQVNPLTVVALAAGTMPLYRIETGERRYWAAVLLQHFTPGRDMPVRLLCQVIPPEKASVFRQARENTARSDLNAVALARQTALLLFAVHGIRPPEGSVDNNFYRAALDLDLKPGFAREQTEAVLAAMGGISRQRFAQYKKLLALSDRAMDYGDANNLPDYALRELAGLSWADQDYYINLAEQHRWTTAKLLDHLKAVDEVDEPEIRHASAAVRVIRRDLETTTEIERVAAELLAAEKGNKARAIGHLQSKIDWLSAIRQRLEG